MTTGIARDLSAKLQGEIAGVLERNLHVFAAVLEPGELGEVVLEAAVMTVRTTAATIAGFATGREEVTNLFQLVTRSIADQVQYRQDEGIEKALAAVAERGR